MPLACIDLLCLCDASRCCAMPLLCLAGLAFAKLCYSFALQRRAGRIHRSAKLSAAPHFLSHASQRPGGADLRDASATPCYAVAFPSRPMPLRFRSAHSYAVAFPSCSMPPQISSVLCLRISAPCHGRSVLCDSLAGLSYALAQLICAVLCLCDSELCYALASPLTSFPCLCDSELCYALALLG